MKPPIAPPIAATLTTAGRQRTDFWYWLHERNNPKVRSYLKAENAYTKAMLSDTEALRQQLFDEITGRIKQDDQSVPFFHNGYWYYCRYEQGLEYSIDCRRKATLDAPEEILIDGNAMAADYDYLDIDNLNVSPNNELMAYAMDTEGSHVYSIVVKDIATGRVVAEIDGTNGAMAWANDNRTLFYCLKDKQTLRSNRLMKRRIDEKTAIELFNETDETFDVGVFRSKSGEMILMESESNTATEVRFVPSDKPDEPFRMLQAREKELEYHADHLGERFYIVTNLDAKNFRLVEAPIDAPAKENWKEIIPYRADVLLEDVELFDDYLAISERENGLLRIRVVSRHTGEGYYLDFGNDEAYTAELSDNPAMDSEWLRVEYGSLTTPCSVIDFNMRTRERIIRKQQEVVGGHNPDDYISKRLYAKAADGTNIPLSLVYRKDTLLDGHTPLLLYGYGAYGYNVDPAFSVSRLSLLNRGFIYAIAHVRGSQYLGREWYEAGKMLNKRNTFSDFIACAEHLVAQGFTDSAHLFAMGASAGGLLIGAVINMRPELFRGVIADVPFVDVVTTMSDTSMPLTVGEFEEWGNPADPEYYDYMLSYSPYDNVRAQDYPHILVTAGLHDAEVQYFEPAKWVAKLRSLKTDANMLLLHTNMEAGHEGASGRFEAYHEIAMEYAFLLKLSV